MENKYFEQQSNLKENMSKLFKEGVLCESDEGKKYIVQTRPRIAVIANVNGVQIPFYQSSSGASGKNKGQWYPFFGNKGAWLMKGGVDSMNKGYGLPEIKKMMDYLDKEVSEDLFENLLTSDQKQVFGNETWKRGAGKLDAVKKQHPEFIINQTDAGEYMAEVLGYELNDVHLDSDEAKSDFITERIKDIKKRLISNRF